MPDEANRTINEEVSGALGIFGVCDIETFEGIDEMPFFQILQDDEIIFVLTMPKVSTKQRFEVKVKPRLEVSKLSLVIFDYRTADKEHRSNGEVSIHTADDSGKASFGGSFSATGSFETLSDNPSLMSRKFQQDVLITFKRQV